MRPTRVAGALMLAACGGSQSGGSDSAPDVARAPARAGEVWELDGTRDRATAGAAVRALAYGLHVMVVDGNQAYAGMSQLKAERGPNGVRSFKLATGLTADLVPAGEGLELRFSTGEAVPLRRREVAP